MHAPRARPVDQAFQRLRRELDVRAGFPEDVLAEATRAAGERIPEPTADRPDLTAVPFCTIDPPGSRDLDQAVHAERTAGGYRLRYAIADVAFFVDRDGPVEREAWQRGVTFYAPDHREPLYPPVLSQGAASLLPDQLRPAVVFDFTLDDGGELRRWSVARAVVRSRAQLTYGQLLRHVERPDASDQRGTAWDDTLTLLGEIGPKRLALEAERGGVSLPVRDQEVQRVAAATLGYELVYEAPNEAERWNAQVSLLTGHVAATLMLEHGVGLLRTMPPFDDGAVARFRRIARTLGFAWPEGTSYAAFMHAVPLDHPHAEVLVRQARRVMRGADYVAFQGEPPEQPRHAAIAGTYAHATAPLRRLADRYVLDLLVTLAAGGRPTAAEVATLGALVPVMNEAGRREGALERRVVDMAEAWTLRERVGSVLPAVAVDVRRDEAEVQVEEPPVRAAVALREGRAPALGERVQVRVGGVDVEEGRIRLELVG